MLSAKPKTRAQLRKVAEGKGNSNRTGKTCNTTTRVLSKEKKKMQNEKVDKKLINEIDEKQKEKKKGWTNLADVENTLIDLERQYKRSKDTLTRKQMGRLIDVYEKQVKALNLIPMKTNKNTENDDSSISQIYTINEESENEKANDEATIMSDVTIKTNNSIITPVYVTPTKSKKGTSKYRGSLEKENLNVVNNKKSTTVLESLGKTRKSKTNKQSKEKTNITTEKGSKSNEENKESSKIITQDDLTVMSKITVEEAKSEEDENVTNHEEATTIERSEEQNERDDITVMSEITMQNQKEITEDKEPTNDKTCKAEGKEKIKTTEGENTKENEKECDNGETKSKEQETTTISECTKGGNDNTNKSDMKQTTTPMKVINPYKTKSTPKKKISNTSEETKINKEKTHAQATKQEIDNSVTTTIKNKGVEHTQESEYIQVRISFTCENTNLSKYGFIKQVVYEVMQCAKTI